MVVRLPKTPRSIGSSLAAPRAIRSVLDAGSGCHPGGSAVPPAWSEEHPRCRLWPREVLHRGGLSRTEVRCPRDRSAPPTRAARGAAGAKTRGAQRAALRWRRDQGPVGCLRGLYFFNPFAENIFHEHDRFDDDVQLSALRYTAELLRVEHMLERARAGSVVVTYHGLGGPIPSTYELITDERAGSDRVRTWVQRPRPKSDGHGSKPKMASCCVPRTDLHHALASLICEQPRLDGAADPLSEEPTGHDSPWIAT